MKTEKKSIGALIGEYGAFIALVILVLGLGIAKPEFRAFSNLTSLLRQASFNGLIAIGMTCVILSDGIDLSVGSVFALSAIICAELIMAGIAAPWQCSSPWWRAPSWAWFPASWSPRAACSLSSQP